MRATPTTSTTATSAAADKEYLLDTGTDLGREQLECLELLLDGHTTAALTAAGIGRGQRCLEIGAGTGSIAPLDGRPRAARGSRGGRRHRDQPTG